MREARIEIDLEEGCIDALVVCAEGFGPWPPVILLAPPDTPPMAIARRLAARGFFVLSPQWPDEPLEEAFDAWLDYLAAERLTDDARIGVLGYGWGAGIGLQLAAAHGERITALALFHPGPLRAQEVHHAAGCLNAVVHLGYAGLDPAWTAEDATLLESELRRAGVDFEVEVYPASPGFAAPEGQTYDPRAAELHWDRLVELFQRTLRPAPEVERREVAAPGP